MFERFTERARQVVVLAQDEARALGHDYIGTEHILLGLLREEDGLAAVALGALGVKIGDVRLRVEELVGRGTDSVVTGQIPFTPRAKRVLELALRESLALGHNYIGSEHIMLGVVRENSGVGARVLREAGIDAQTARDEIVRVLASGRSPFAPRSMRPSLEFVPATPPVHELVVHELLRLRSELERALEGEHMERAAVLRERHARIARAAEELQRAWDDHLRDES